jgi:ribonucleoside-diphosphate reductase alpha chain
MAEQKDGAMVVADDVVSSMRSRLPSRRSHELFDFDHGGFRFTAGIGRFDDGRIAEIFLNAARTGTAIETVARDSAVVASLALQFGANLDTIRRALCRDARGNATGPLGAALDLIAEESAS